MSVKVVVAIAGSTASGKSHMAVRLAKHYNGEVVSCDSRQVYKGMPIGTGQIPRTEMQGIPHHMLGVVDPRHPYTVAEYKKATDAIVRTIHNNGSLPFLVGGTGLYMDTVLNNITYPTVSPKRDLRTKLNALSIQELMERLKNTDKSRAHAIDPHNKQRIIRALEIIHTTQKPVQPLLKKPLYKSLILGIHTEKDVLYKNIEQRFMTMLKMGHVEEVEYLHSHYNVSFERIDELGLSYKWIGRYLQKKITYQEMIEKSITSIRHYAKRQMTWFSKNKDIVWIQTYEEARREIDRFLLLTK